MQPNTSLAPNQAQAPAQQLSGTARLKSVLDSPQIAQRFEKALGKSTGTFLTSILELYQSDAGISACDPDLVVKECLKAATLNLPINKNLGLAYIIAYKEHGTPTPQFQLGYKGLVNLALRSGQYTRMNADIVYEGEQVEYDKITGSLSLSGEPVSENAIGYFAYFKMVNGFEKAIYWSKERVEAHAKKFSAAYKFGRKDSPWLTSFDQMAIKTVLKHLITHFGIVSIEFASALSSDETAEERVDREVAANANGRAVVLPSNIVEAEVRIDDAPMAQEQPAQQPPTQDDDDASAEEPGF